MRAPVGGSTTHMAVPVLRNSGEHSEKIAGNVK
jgi:hypothetical protein